MTKKPTDPHADHRKHQRVPATFIVTYKLKSTIDVALKLMDKEMPAVAVDISEGGMGLDVAQNIPVGAFVRLKFMMLNDLATLEPERQRQFLLDAECRFSEPTPVKSYRVGVKFNHISKEDKKFITEFIRDQALSTDGLPGPGAV